MFRFLGTVQRNDGVAIGVFATDDLGGPQVLFIGEAVLVVGTDDEADDLLRAKCVVRATISG